MPKFLYTIFLAAGGFWFTWYKILQKTKPDTTLKIILFIFSLFIAIALTNSIVLYFILHKKAPRFSNLREIYRKSLKLGALISFGVIALLILKMWGLLNVVTFILFTSLYVLSINSLRK